MVTAYSYTRLSTEKQLKGYGAQRQQQAIEQAAINYNWKLSEQTFEDFGVSAWKGANRKHGQLAEFLQLARTGHIAVGSVLIVENADRLSREGVNPSLRLLLELLDLGIALYTLTDDKLYTGNEESAMMDLMTWMLVAQRAREESDMKSQRIRDSRRRAKDGAREGKFMNRRLPAWLQWGEGRQTMEFVPDIADVVVRIFQMYADGISLKPIAQRLNAEGVEYWGKSKRWTHTTVRNLLKQESVTGRFQPLVRTDSGDEPDGDPIEDYYPRLVSKELWATTANLRSSKANSRGRQTVDGEMRNLFKGLLKCSCGSGLALNSSVQKGKRYSALRCSKLRTDGCQEKNWHYGAFEKITLLGLAQLDWSALLERTIDSHEKEAMLERKEVLEAELRESDSKRDNLGQAIAKSYSDGLVKMFEVQEAESKRLSSELSGVVASLNLIELEANSRNDHLEEIQSVFEEVANNPDARFKANQILRKNLSCIRVGSAERYQTLDRLEVAMDSEGRRLLANGLGSIKGVVDIVPKSGKELRIEVLEGYKRSFVWQEDYTAELGVGAEFIELHIEHVSYNKRSTGA